MYVRVDGIETEEVVSGETTFAGITADGAEVFYVLAGDAFVFDVASEETRQLTSSGDISLVNIAANGSRVYFISPSQLDGAKGTPGENNLYVWDADSETTTFIAEVAPADVEGYPSLTNWTSKVVLPEGGSGAGPGSDPSRTTPDGSVLVFESRAPLTSYENEGHNEIYRYDAEGLVCVSCNPSSAPATGDARLEAVSAEAASSQTIVHNLSEDGARVVFETEESLVARDTDGSNDIYEWSGGGGEGEASLALLSSGKTTTFRPGTSTNFLYGVTPSGDDVVFGSWDSLVPSAPAGGVQAIYDARVNGGFAEPLAEPCSGDACQGPPGSAPALSAPASESFLGNGNAKAGRRLCRRHRKVRGAARRRICRRRHSHSHRRRTSNTARPTLGAAR
jgi:hypothetical protein